LSQPPARVDSPDCRIDLIQKSAAAGATFRSAFDWINDKQALLVASNPDNRGLTAKEIRELAEEWINLGGKIKCVPETRESYRDRRYFHYDVIIIPLSEFPRGLYVEMELSNPDENDPSVSLLNAHPEPGS
jgi:hypothetical protein